MIYKEDLESLNSLELSEVTPEKIIRSHSEETFCRDVRNRMEDEKTTFSINNTGILCGKFDDNQQQIVVPKDLRTNILFITHHSMVSGHTAVYECMRISVGRSIGQR